LRNEDDIERVKDLLSNERAQIQKLNLERKQRLEDDKNNPNALPAKDAQLGEMYRTKNNALVKIESQKSPWTNVYIYQTNSYVDLNESQYLFTDGLEELKWQIKKVQINGDYKVTKDGEIILTNQEKKMKKSKTATAEQPATTAPATVPAPAAAPAPAEAESKKRGKAKRPETALIDDGIASGKDNEAILKALGEQFPKGDLAWFKKTLSARRWFAKKAK
jgi:hypothetical protein